MSLGLVQGILERADRRVYFAVFGEDISCVIFFLLVPFLLLPFPRQVPHVPCENPPKRPPQPGLFKMKTSLKCQASSMKSWIPKPKRFPPLDLVMQPDYSSGNAHAMSVLVYGLWECGLLSCGLGIFLHCGALWCTLTPPQLLNMWNNMQRVNLWVFDVRFSAGGPIAVPSVCQQGSLIHRPQLSLWTEVRSGPSCLRLPLVSCGVKHTWLRH